VTAPDKLGIYSDFPNVIHHSGTLRIFLPVDLFKRAIIEGFIKLNKTKDTIHVSRAGKIGEIKVRRIFEVGIAEGLNFNFLDNKEIKKIRKWILELPLKQTYDPLDFVVFTHYRYSNKTLKRSSSLHFDQYFVRVDFQKPILLFNHLSGLQRTPPHEIIDLIISFTNNWISDMITQNPDFEGRLSSNLFKRKKLLVQVIPRE
jgi:hypothetical protein